MRGTSTRFATQYPLDLTPGLNRVRIVNRVTDELTSCSFGTSGGQGCLVAGFEEARNPDVTKRISFGNTADGSFTLEVWTPPTYE